MTLRLNISCVILVVQFIAESAAQQYYSEQWPGFRGPFATGIIDNADTPVEWDVGSGKNIKWKTRIPGLGHSCPVIWNDYVFVTTAVSGSGEDYLKVGLYGDIDMVDDESIHGFKVYCLDKNTGEIIWDRLSHIGVPKTKRLTKSSHANCTPAADGEHLVVYFGSEGLFCYDLEGNLLWKKDLGVINAGPYTEPEVEWGIASSPLIYGDYLYNLRGNGSLSCFHASTGELIYKESLGVSGGITASGIASDGKLYFSSENGKVYVIAAGPVYKRLAVNDMDDICMATPAISKGIIYFRTASYLIAVSEE